VTAIWVWPIKGVSLASDFFGPAAWACVVTRGAKTKGASSIKLLAQVNFSVRAACGHLIMFCLFTKIVKEG
jgi:hypothetical protein